jgi:heme/copper-type cytochrome/quinol oxidase subunit 4
MSDPQQDDGKGARMGALAGLIVIVILLGASLWVVSALMDMVKVQNCAQSGRRDCAEIPGQ